MTEPLPTTTTPSEPIAYQPISGWAIAGFTIGSLYTLLVVICALVGLHQGAPVFFPAWIMAFAILGLALSILALRHIRNSEGTRAGAKLARAGIWLSLVSGLTYFSYYAVTGMALQNQADAFLREKTDEYSGFFPRLLESGNNPVQLNAAFLLTLPPSTRSASPDDEANLRKLHDISPREGAPGPYTQFRESIFARIFSKHLGKDAEIIPLAVQDWRYEQRSYKVRRLYRIKTREIELEILIAVFSAEAEAPGESRRWVVDLRESYVTQANKKLSPLGEGLRQLRQQAGDWLGIRGQLLNSEFSLGDNIAALDKTNWGNLPDAKDAEIKNLIHQALTPGSSVRPARFQVLTKPDEVGRWEQLDGTMSIDLLFAFDLPMSPVRPPLRIEGTATLESTAKIDPAKFDADSKTNWILSRLVFTAVRRINPQPPKQ
jgi:hypothetical protein